MATAAKTASIFQELADLFASCPPPEKIMKFRPSKALQRRARALLTKQGAGRQLTDDEEREMNEFLQAEFFMRLVKAKVHALQGVQA